MSADADRGAPRKRILKAMEALLSPWVFDGSEPAMVELFAAIDEARAAVDPAPGPQTRQESPIEARTALDLLAHVQQRHEIQSRGDFIECSCGTSFWFASRPAPGVVAARPQEEEKKDDQSRSDSENSSAEVRSVAPQPELIEVEKALDELRALEVLGWNRGELGIWSVVQYSDAMHVLLHLRQRLRAGGVGRPSTGETQ